MTAKTGNQHSTDNKHQYGNIKINIMQKQAIQMTAGEINSLLAFVEDFNFDGARVSPGTKKRLTYSGEIVKSILSKDKTFLRFVPPDNIYSVLFNPSDIEAVKSIVNFAIATGHGQKLTGLSKGRKKKAPLQKLKDRVMYRPLINILVRTSKRPRFFKACIESIKAQTYDNVRLIVSCDDTTTYKYVKGYDDIDLVLELKRGEKTGEQENLSFIPGVVESPFHANTYLNNLLSYCLPGYVVFLDDDNVFTSSRSLKTIVANLENEHQMAFWRVEFPYCLVPDNWHFGQPPQPGQIDLGGFAFHTGYIKHCVFDGYSYSDFRAALNLFMHIPQKVYINEPIISLQALPGKGQRKDKELSHQTF